MSSTHSTMYADCCPPWSTFTLPPRGTAVPLGLDQNLVEIIEQEIENADRRAFYEAPYRSAMNRLDALDTVVSPAPTSPYFPNYSAAVPSIPTPQDSETAIRHLAGEWAIQRRSLSPLRDLNPMPDVFTSAHLDLMKFRRISWDDPRAFVDAINKIGAFFIGPPTERDVWENTIIEANHLMQRVRGQIDRQGVVNDTLSTGFRYGARQVERPQNFKNNETNAFLLAELRLDPNIQAITSFQNAALQTVAPKIWASAHETIETVMANDCTLTLPLYQATGRARRQPTAFSQVDYRFSIEDSRPVHQIRDRPTAWTAFTSLGNYGPGETDLILWHNRTVVSFAPGSTFVLPAGLFSFSFTGASDPGSRMLISQTCDGEMYRFVESGMSFELDLPRFDSAAHAQEQRNLRAERAIELFPTLDDFDSRVRVP
ncbi:hypothetical protein C8F04DRAFT_1270093 [Mycena alexandri]|uniref:Uncharacterized protein n=1 Tax=Mycena alexandri TaxID=1745969 RepID=A0AAD6SBL5_9AGAR|nr:hypothetical protein C8F04DRAFT_1270093 [Mycena alexandri]